MALLLLLPFALGGMRREWGLIRAHLPRLALLALLGVALFNTCVYIGLQSTTAINALLINSAIPVWIMLLAMSFIRKPVTGRTIWPGSCSLCAAWST
ncbi:MAG: EamA family transporter [gamma proteobacterium symbiont of Phacoides pectinatus]